MSQEAHIDNLDLLADLHSDLIDRGLLSLEEAVAAIIANLPTKDGKLFDLDAAILVRQALQRAMSENFGKTTKGIVETYDGAVGTLALVYAGYLTTRKLSAVKRGPIVELKRIAKKGFDDLANVQVEAIAKEVYQSTLTGRSITEATQSVRHAINGVYIQSNDEEAQALVEFIDKNKDDVGKAKDVDKAIDSLKANYSNDKVGANLRRYAKTYAHDSLMQFNATANMAMVADLGIKKWLYRGSLIKDSRDWCAAHQGRVMTTEQIRDEWANSNWKGKAGGDPFIVRGGYNCRHWWEAVIDD